MGLKWRKRRQKKEKKKKGDEDAEEDEVGKDDSPMSKQKSHEPLTGSEEFDGEALIVASRQNSPSPASLDEVDDVEELYEYLWSKWAFWNHIGFNRAYLFRYGFRMCDVFSRLMIMALIWCTLSGTATFFIISLEILTFVGYATTIGM